MIFPSSEALDSATLSPFDAQYLGNMALPQQKMRELVFHLLYSYDLGSEASDGIVKMLMREFSVTKKGVMTAFRRAEAVRGHQEELDRAIAAVSKAYALDRIQLVELNILRLATYELTIDDEIPPKVAISEAIRLTRKFGTPEGATFVNALLDAIYRGGEGDVAVEEALAAKQESEAAAHEAAIHEEEGNDTTDPDGEAAQ